jgi:hypothetical protein
MRIDPTATQEFRQHVYIVTKLDPEFTQLPQTLSCRLWVLLHEQVSYSTPNRFRQ